MAPATVIGAGISGLATALALHNSGVPVRVLEAAPGLSNEGSAIGMWDNAWRALDELGVADQLRPQYLNLSR
jgi:2-polyprenyl-6-methoxyphenol hydroxylase-like FAD-dependent oxidoreductase